MTVDWSNQDTPAGIVHRIQNEPNMSIEIPIVWFELIRDLFEGDPALIEKKYRTFLPEFVAERFDNYAQQAQFQLSLRAYGAKSEDDGKIN